MRRGFLIVEVLIALLIFSMIVLSMFSSISFVLLKTERSRYDAEAALLAQEGVEVAYNVMMSGEELSGGVYWPVVDASGKWQMLMTGMAQSDIQTRYKRTLEVDRVCRKAGGVPDAGERVACSAGELDSHSKVIKSVVEWTERDLQKKVETELLVWQI